MNFDPKCVQPELLYYSTFKYFCIKLSEEKLSSEGEIADDDNTTACGHYQKITNIQLIKTNIYLLLPPSYHHIFKKIIIIKG